MKNSYKAQGKEKAEEFLAKRKRTSGEEKKALKEAEKNEVKKWKRSLSSVDKAERKAQKKGYKAYKRRKNRVRRGIAWALVACILVTVVGSAWPTISMLTKVMSTQKYTSEGPEAEKVREAGYKLSTEICEDGFVLLKNDDNVLPLKGKKLNIFGDDAYNFIYGGSGSAGADQSGAETIFEAFDKKGIEYNKELDKIYRDSDISKGGSGTIKEMLVNYFTGGEESDDWTELDDAQIKKAREYSDTALIVLSSMEVEGAELEIKKLQITGDGMPNRTAMIKNVLNTFEHVIFVINSGNVMEMNFLNEYDSADAALWVGAPGSHGCSVIADVLTGKVNPSGRTVDTWPVSIESEPAFANYGNFKYDNLDMFTMEYSEGIYVGYRYYETRYGNNADEYKKNVVFPFGYGISYTTFTEEITDFKTDDKNITITVKVTNTGGAPGKDVVQCYFSAPYYKENKIEKSAIELAGYAKTNVIEKGESETVTITFPVRDMASYAKHIDGGCYILEKGDYKISVGKTVHDALLSDNFKTYTVNDNIKYTTDSKTGVKIENRFGFAEGDVKYLSREDWAGTFPKVPETYTASDELIKAKNEYESGKTKYTEIYTKEPIYNADNGITLADLKGLDYNDQKWEKFLDQFTVKEMINLTANGGWHTEAVDRLDVRPSHLLDGPSGINSMFAPLNAVAYPMETVISSSWNNSLALRLGEAIGDEAAVYGVNGWYAPAMNIHRTSIGGRNSEYFSEDPLLSGKMASAAVQGAQSKGMIAFMKHFVCNDVELNARNGIIIWTDEQALREIYLPPFETAVKDGGAHGAMSSFSYLGSKWCGGSTELLNDLLRGEWGFEGVVCTDATLGSWMNAERAVKYGNDLMLEMGLQQSVKKLNKAYKADPIGTAYGLRNSVHNICFALVNGTNLY